MLLMWVVPAVTGPSLAVTAVHPLEARATMRADQTSPAFLPATTLNRGAALRSTYSVAGSSARTSFQPDGSSTVSENCCQKVQLLPPMSETVNTRAP